MNTPIQSLLQSAKQRNQDIKGKLQGVAKMLETPSQVPMLETHKRDQVKTQLLNQMQTDQVANNILQDNSSYYDYGPTEVPATLGSGNKYLDYIASKESPGPGNPYLARNPKSSASGKYQFIDSTLAPYLKQIGATKQDYMNDSAIQEYVAGLHLDNILSEMKKRGIPINNKTVYGAWQQGVGGLVNVLNGIAPKGDALTLNVPAGQSNNIKGLTSYW